MEQDCIHLQTRKMALVETKSIGPFQPPEWTDMDLWCLKLPGHDVFVVAAGFRWIWVFQQRERVSNSRGLKMEGSRRREEERGSHWLEWLSLKEGREKTHGQQNIPGKFISPGPWGWVALCKAVSAGVILCVLLGGDGGCGLGDKCMTWYFLD